VAGSSRSLPTSRKARIVTRGCFAGPELFKSFSMRPKKELEDAYLANAEFSRRFHDEWSTADAELD
jgi:hypothetical protein